MRVPLEFLRKGSIAALAALALLLAGCKAEKELGGQITVESLPEKAEIFLNGTLAGQTPATIPSLAPGEYLVELRKAGFNRAYKAIALLEGREVDIEIPLVPVCGLLLVDSDPAEAEVVIDGDIKGKTPVLLTDFPLGSYTIEIRSPKYLPRTMVVELSDRIPVQVFAELVSNTARLTVSSVPDEAEVRINGVPVGTTPVTLGEVLAGEAEVRVSRRGYALFQKRIVFEANRPYEINAELEALPSGLTIITIPEGAKIMVDNKPVGEAPVTLSNLKGGSHEVRAVLEGYASEVKTVNLEPDVDDSIEFSMEKDSGTLVIDTEPANVQIYVDGKLFATTQSKGESDAISSPVHITLKSAIDHNLQLVREGFMASSITVQTEIDQVVTRHEVLKRIFVYDSKIITDSEIIKCRIEYTLPNGNIYYERYPGVFNTAKVADIRDVQPVSLNDESNRDARRMIEESLLVVP